jgi:hypothetical protein
VTTLFYLGGEQAGWRTLLRDNGIDNVGMSYWSWRKRLPRKGVDIASYGFAGVLLESGGYQANAKPEQHTVREWKAYGAEYAAFVLEHIDDLTLFSEFDCLALGPDYIAEQRREVWSQVDPEKFLPVWHPEQGLPALEELGNQYPRVAISEQAITGGGLNVTPQLNALARKGVKLHGVAMTKPTVLRQVAFATAASTSWLSPMRFGDTLVWENGQLTRYPMKMKDQARRRHSALFEREGFDVERILADDKDEVTRLSLWSWRQQEQALQQLRTNSTGEALVRPQSGTDDAGVGTQLHGARNDELAPQVLQQRPEEQMRALPMFGSREVKEMNAETREVETIEVLEVRGSSARRCDTCVIKDRCPEFKPATTCAFSIPVAIKTKQQRAAFLTGMIELQAQRVQFMAMVEQINGGYPDPNLSQEYDRLLKAMTTQADLEDNRDFLKISVEARGKTGALSRLFGTAPAARAVEQPRVIEGNELDELTRRVSNGQRVT